MAEDYRVLKSRIRSAIRQVWSRYSEERKRVLYEAKRTRRLVRKDGTLGTRPDIWYVCANCKKEHKLKDVQVDHIKPLGATPPFPDSIDDTRWISWIRRLFCNSDNLQVLCKTCHNAKTKAEKAIKGAKQKASLQRKRKKKVQKPVLTLQRKVNKKSPRRSKGKR